MMFVVKLYDGVKYLPETKKVSEVIYDNVKNFEVKELTGKELEEKLETKQLDGVDEVGEYLILTLEDKRTVTFRNSHVDLFRY